MRPARTTTRIDGSAYFVSTQTADRRSLFRVEAWAKLMVKTIQHYDPIGYGLHAFVVMPDHLHLLLSPNESLEKAVQLVKGGSSFRAKKELGWNGEIWQPGFTDHRVRDEQDWERHLNYIRQNPVEARLAEHSALYEFMGFPNIAFPQGLKPPCSQQHMYGLKPVPSAPARVPGREPGLQAGDSLSPDGGRR